MTCKIVPALVFTFVLIVSSRSLASDLHILLGAYNTADAIVVCPGASVPYEVWGLVSVAGTEAGGGVDNFGLAGFAFDLTFEGGPLTPASPGPNIVSSFVAPAGFTNATATATGFGGRDDVPGREGELVQIGGAQNTINNVAANAALPIGDPVITGLGSPALMLAQGTVIAPTIPGSYVLSIPADSIQANVIKLGETGDSYWATEPAGLGYLSDLDFTITVVNSPTINQLEVFYQGRFGDQADTSKWFLASGGVATLSNATNYLRGITGIRLFFDQVVGFATTPENAFSFEWTTGSGTTFSAVENVASNMTITSATVAGATVVTINIADDHVRGRWLKVTTLADQVQAVPLCAAFDGELSGNPITLPGGNGAPGGDAVFYVGNVPGDVDGNRKVELAEIGLIRLAVNPFLATTIDNIHDVDKDGKVLLDDVGDARLEVNPFFTLPLISP